MRDYRLHYNRKENKSEPSDFKGRGHLAHHSFIHLLIHAWKLDAGSSRGEVENLSVNNLGNIDWIRFVSQRQLSWTRTI